MKKALFAFIGIVLCIQLTAQVTYQDSTKFYSFKVNYWFNLHHFLHLESFLNVNADSTILTKQLDDDAQQKLDAALSYYRENLAELDLRTSDYMTNFKQWITGQDRNLSEIPNQFKEHMDVLQEVSQVYETEFWPEQRQACLKVLNENIEIIRSTEEKFVDQITTLTRQFWQPEKLAVDIAYYGKVTKRNLRNRPYTSIFPTHVVMNAVGENAVPGNWLELLYHESAHHLILTSSYFIGGTIKDVAEAMGEQSPRQLGHSYLFYFTGRLTQQLLEEAGIAYPITYMERNKVFWRYYPLLNIHLNDYMNRKITLAEATERMINDLKK